MPKAMNEAEDEERARRDEMDLEKQMTKTLRNKGQDTYPNEDRVPGDDEQREKEV